MIPWRRHLAERQLLDRYVADRTEEAVDAAVAAHLDACASCASRYTALAAFMDDVRAEADTDVDAWFPEDRLQAARRQIARRIEHLGQVARVISFPGRQAPPDSGRALPGRSARWIAAAAAAGLLVGIALGTYTDQVTARAGEGQAAIVSAASEPDAGPTADDLAAAAIQILDEEAFLQEVELASVGLRTRALMPIDAFTPSVREVSAQLR